MVGMNRVPQSRRSYRRESEVMTTAETAKGIAVVSEIRDRGILERLEGGAHLRSDME